MSIIIKLENEYYDLGDKFTLIKREEPPASEDGVINGDSIALKVTKASNLEAAGKVFTKVKETYGKVAEKAASTGKDADGAARLAAAAELAVAHQVYMRRHEVVQAANEELPEVPGADDPAEPKSEPPAEPDVKDDADETKPADSTDGDAPPEDDKKVEVPDDLSALDDLDEKKLVTAVAGASPSAVIQPGETFDPSKAYNLGDVPRQPAKFITAAGLADVGMGAVLEGAEADSVISKAVDRVIKGKNQVNTLIGEYAVNTRATLNPSEMLDRRKDQAPLIVTAAGELCDHNERRILPDCDDITGDLTGMFETYAADRCQIRYLKDIGLADLNDGVYVWDDAAKQAYCDAKDDYRAAIQAGDAAAVTVALAQLEITQKRCMETDCLEWSDLVTMVSHYSCLQYSIENVQCNPEHIARHRRLLAKKFLRVGNAYMLAFLAANSIRVTADASADPFLMQSGVQLDASAVFDQVVCELIPQGVMAERVTEGNYVAVVPYGMVKALGLGNRKACQNLQNDISEATGIDNVIITKDVAASAADIAPTGPYPVLPEPGTTVDFNDIRLPTDWQVHIFDPNDYFRISRPTVELGAQVTHESIKGNEVAGEWLETHVGYGKDGCHPSWTVDFTNLCYSGVRAGCDLPKPCINVPIAIPDAGGAPDGDAG